MTTTRKGGGVYRSSYDGSKPYCQINHQTIDVCCYDQDSTGEPSPHILHSEARASVKYYTSRMFTSSLFDTGRPSLTTQLASIDESLNRTS